MFKRWNLVWLWLGMEWGMIWFVKLMFVKCFYSPKWMLFTLWVICVCVTQHCCIYCFVISIKTIFYWNARPSTKKNKYLWFIFVIIINGSPRKYYKYYITLNDIRKTFSYRRHCSINLNYQVSKVSIGLSPFSA